MKLKPCPFCGEDSDITLRKKEYPGKAKDIIGEVFWFVECLPCDFGREEYLECSDEFESITIPDVQHELTEFSDDAIDLAFELAYTRYALAKAELEIKTLKTELAWGNKQLIEEYEIVGCSDDLGGITVLSINSNEGVSSVTTK